MVTGGTGRGGAGRCGRAGWWRFAKIALAEALAEAFAKAVAEAPHGGAMRLVLPFRLTISSNRPV